MISSNEDIKYMCEPNKVSLYLSFQGYGHHGGHYGGYNYAHAANR